MSKLPVLADSRRFPLAISGINISAMLLDLMDERVFNRYFYDNGVEIATFNMLYGAPPIDSSCGVQSVCQPLRVLQAGECAFLWPYS